MKLILKNLKQKVFPIEVESDKISIEKLKILIEEKYEYDSKVIKLLYSGKILDNTKTLEDYNITDGQAIIMMSLTNISSQQRKINEGRQPKENETKEELYSKQINTLVDLGYKKEKVEKIINIANGCVEFALEFLEEDDEAKISVK